MNASWYCIDCERGIDSEAIEEHEADGHHVRGMMRPDRLLGNDPWNLDVQTGDEGVSE